MHNPVSGAACPAGTCKPVPIINSPTAVCVCDLGSVCPENLNSDLVLSECFNVPVRKDSSLGQMNTSGFDRPFLIHLFNHAFLNLFDGGASFIILSFIIL